MIYTLLENLVQKGGNMNIGTQEIAMIISVISAVISLVSVGTSIYYNNKNQKQYNRSLEPALSFRLLELNRMLYLQIINTGKSAAQNIKITVKTLENNGSGDGLCLDKLFNKSFDLYAGETTQGCVGMWGENIVDHTFPKLTIDVEYIQYITKKTVCFSRNVIFNPSYAAKVYADVNIDMNEINKNISRIAKANLRTANYLDGCQVAPFDDLNILANKSLHDDMLDIQKGNKQSNIQRRDETIVSCFHKNKKKERRHRTRK